MRQTSILGIFIAVFAISASQLLEGYSLSMLFQPTAILIVLGGTLGAVVARSSYKELTSALSLLKWLVQAPADGKELTNQLVQWAKVANTQGTLKLDEISRSQPNSILRSGLEMISDNHSAEYIKETLLIEVYARDLRCRQAIKVWSSAAKSAPLVGLLGSILGLLNGLSDLNSLEFVGSSIAASFVATAYGLGLANFVLSPIAQSLRGALVDLTYQDEVRIEGLGMIADKKAPSVMRRSLAAMSGASGNVTAPASNKRISA